MKQSIWVNCFFGKYIHQVTRNSSITENPPIDKALKKKRKKEDEKEHVQEAKLFCPDASSSSKSSEKTKRNFDLNGSSSSSSASSEDNADEKPDDIDPDETPSARFRRGCDLPSDLDMGSDYSQGSQDPVDDDDEWISMGSALEREFLGLDWWKCHGHKFSFFLLFQTIEIARIKMEI